jgi:hypothetical protein
MVVISFRFYYRSRGRKETSLSAAHMELGPSLSAAHVELGPSLSAAPAELEVASLPARGHILATSNVALVCGDIEIEWTPTRARQYPVTRPTGEEASLPARGHILATPMLHR